MKRLGNGAMTTAGVAVGVLLGAWSLNSTGCGCPEPNDPVGLFEISELQREDAAVGNRLTGTISISEDEMLIEYVVDDEDEYVVRYQRQGR